MKDVRQLVRPRPFGHINENVKMRPSDAEKVSESLEVQPIFVCASDFGWITRPRLWWMSVPWADHATDPDTCHMLVLARNEGWHRLRLDAPRRALQDMDLYGLARSSTTPAADENGRPAAKGA